LILKYIAQRLELGIQLLQLSANDHKNSLTREVFESNGKYALHRLEGNMGLLDAFSQELHTQRLAASDPQLSRMKAFAEGAADVLQHLVRIMLMKLLVLLLVLLRLLVLTSLL